MSSKGSGLWSKMHALVGHLAQGAGGLVGEVAQVRRDLLTTLTPLVAVTVEEYDLPAPISINGIKLDIATSLTPVSYSGSALDGAIGAGKISPPRPITVIVPNVNPTHAPATFTITGLDVQGKPISEVVTGCNAGGGGTYSTKTCFAYVTNVSAIAGTTAANATFHIGVGNSTKAFGLSLTPKLRSGQTVPLVRREVYDGSVVTSGTLTAVATHPPYGAYIPSVDAATVAAATTSGSVDMTTAGLYGAGTLDTTVLVITVNGVGPVTLTFAAAGNAANEAAALAAIAAAFPGLVVTTDAVTHHLILTDSLSGAQESFIIAADVTSTANPFLGLTAGTYAGTGHRYTYEYEFDGSQQVVYDTVSVLKGAAGPVVPPPGSGAPSV